MSQLSYRFVHLIEEAFRIPIGTFDAFFSAPNDSKRGNSFLPPQHRIKLLKYPKTASGNDENIQSNNVAVQGVGPHKDSSGWLTFLYQVGAEAGLEVLQKDGQWQAAPPIANTLVVNFGNAFEAATDGAVRATVHRVVLLRSLNDRFSIPFFMGLPLDLSVTEIRSRIPERVRMLRRNSDGISAAEAAISTFLDPRWDNLGESQLRKWIRSHKDVGEKWYGSKIVTYYCE